MELLDFFEEPDGPLVQLRILDRRCHDRGQQQRDVHVLVAELGGALFLGQVEIADDTGPADDRHAQERMHRRMIGREPDRRRMPLEVGHPNHLALPDDQPEHAVPHRRVADQGALLIGEPRGRERLEGAVIRIEEADRRVLRMEQVARQLCDPGQGGVEVEFADQFRRCPDQLFDSIAARSHEPYHKASWIVSTDGMASPGVQWNNPRHAFINSSRLEV